MSNETIVRLVAWLMAAMQLSVLVPMVVVWRRQQYFPAPVRALSWYVYLSALGALGGRFSAPQFLANNYVFTFGFNAGKIALFAWVYHWAFASYPQWRWIKALIIFVLMGSVGVFFYDALLGIAFVRVAQCALLAGFAIFYLDQYFSQPTQQPATQTPLWLLSVGQLLYSAGTVTSFSFDYMPEGNYHAAIKYFFVALAGLLFNWFLTLAFLRARPEVTPQLAVGSPPENVFTGS